MEAAKGEFTLSAAQKAQLTKEANRLQRKRTSKGMEAGAALSDSSHIRAADACAALLKQRPALFCYTVKDMIETGVLEKTLEKGDEEEGVANECFRTGCARWWQVPQKFQEKLLRRLSPAWHEAYRGDHSGLPNMLALLQYALHVGPTSWLPSHQDKKYIAIPAFVDLCVDRYKSMGSRLQGGPVADMKMKYWELRAEPPSLVYMVNGHLGLRTLALTILNV
eukprot:6491206-Amphidinium_carterae.2